MPIFSRENPDGWLLRAERFFYLHKYSEADRLEAVVVTFEGDALLWYQWERKCRSILMWVELRGLSLKQFRALVEGSLHEQWMDLRQEGSVSEYHWQFIARVAPLEEVLEICFVSKFISGLWPEIRRELRLLQPIGLG